MKKSTAVTIILIVILVFILLTIVSFLKNRNGILVSPGLGKASGQAATPIPGNTTTAYNPPKEIKYGSSTDLQKELDFINPQVLDSDFE